MDKSFFESHVHEGPHVVLGKRLHPLCLHDFLRFILVGSPYGVGSPGNQVTLGDLRVAVTICSTELDDFAEAVSHDRLVPVVKNLWWKYRTRNASLTREAKAFDAYFNDYWGQPETWDKGGEGSAIGAPWPLAVVASIMVRAKGAMTRKEIWTAPVGEMLWLNAALLEQAGATEIMSAEQREAMYVMGLIPRPGTKEDK